MINPLISGLTKPVNISKEATRQEILHRGNSMDLSGQLYCLSESNALDSSLKLRFTERLRIISALKDDWNGEGGSSIDKEIVKTFENFVKSLPLPIILNISPNSILPTPYGTLLLEIDRADNEFSLEFANNGMSYFGNIGDNEFECENLEINFNSVEYEKMLTYLLSVFA